MRAPVAVAVLLGISCSQAERIDHHQHLYSPAAGANTAIVGPKGIPVGHLIAEMDKAGIARAVVLSVAYSFANPNKPPVADEYAKVQAENDWTAAQVALYPSRLIGFCSVNPVKEYAVAEIERCAKNPGVGAGLKLHFGNSDVDVENPDHLAQLRRVFRAANRNGMAIVGHVRSTISRNRPYGAKQARVFLEQLLPEAPDVTVQLAHLAGSGGFDDPAVDEALGVYAEAIARNDPRMKNVYFDVSGLAGLGKWEQRAPLAVARMRQLGINRLVYGSDAPIAGNLPSEVYARWRQTPLTGDEFRVIENNAAPYLRNRPAAPPAAAPRR